MKSVSYQYAGESGFREEVAQLRDDLAGRAHGPVLFHVFAECWCKDEVRAIRGIVKEAFPDAMLVGTASFGNICDGVCARGDIVVTAMVFEEPSTRVEVLSCPLEPGRVAASLEGFVAEVGRRPWVKAVEAFVMADVDAVTQCCDALEALPEDIEFFGGKSRFDHAPDAPKFVIDDSGECLESTAAFVLYGGGDLHVQTGLILGWNPLGRAMKVTKSHGDVLCELDGRPAHELYYKYLHIANDENYFFNTLEFPFLFYKDGASEVRISHACLDDGSMVLGATIPDNDYVRIAYGDANEIMECVLEGGRGFEAFRPDALVLYSCACRRTYWGDDRSNRETEPFQALAPTSGFYTAGELLRRDGKITEHNSTLIVAAFREGEADAKPAVTFGMDESDISHDDSTVSRLSTFVAAAIDELENANADLARANAELGRLSITDGLTGLLNRREIERRIRAALADGVERDEFCLVMMDLDDFKGVNDGFGHQEGDRVLQAFADLLREQSEACDSTVEFGRWGGEEFIAVAPVGISRAQAFAESVRAAYESRAFGDAGRQTVSIGIAGVTAGDDADSAISRADAAMYEAKRHGKNRVFTA